MLMQHTNHKKLSFITTIAFLIIGFSVMFTMPAQAGEEFIGPKGGQVDAKHDSYLIVPEGALGDEAAALEALDNAIALLDAQYAYIDGLSIVLDDPSGEWVKEKEKDKMLNKNEDVKDEINESKEKHFEGKAKDAWEKTNDALDKLDDLREYVAELLEDGKMGQVAHDTIQEQSDTIEPELTFAVSQLGTEIEGDSYDFAIPQDESEIEDVLNQAMAILEAQFDYIDGLPTKKPKDGPDEWVKVKKDEDYKKSTSDKSKKGKDKVRDALKKFDEDDGLEVLKKAKDALKKLDEMDAYTKQLVVEKKMGVVASDTIEAYSDDAYPILELIDSLYYVTLEFEFGPHGTEFAVPAELVIPWDEIILSDELLWYSEGGEIVDLIDLDYFIDEENQTVHFFIDHFSRYYYARP